MEIKPIAYFHSPLKEKFGITRQAGLVPELEGELHFCDGFDPASLEGLEGFDYIWLIWGFDRNRGRASAKVRPPRLGGNEKLGVYATRSPYRPNPIGLSSVKIKDIDASAGVIRTLGADLADGTPVYDVKPYLEYADSHPGARSGFVGKTPRETLEVVLDKFSPEGSGLSSRDLSALEAILSQDPRPAYQDDPSRVYGLAYKDKNVRFVVDGRTLKVIEIQGTT